MWYSNPKLPLLEGMDEGHQRNQKSGKITDKKGDALKATFYFGSLSICSNNIIIRIQTHIKVVSGQTGSDGFKIHQDNGTSQWLLLDFLLILQEWLAPEGQNHETQLRQKNSN